MRTVPNVGSPFAHLARAPLAAENEDDQEKRDKDMRRLEDDGKDTDETDDEEEMDDAAL